MPAERKKLNDERAKLKVYRSQLMQLGDSVPNMQELMDDNVKIIAFFEGEVSVQPKEVVKVVKKVKPLDKPKQVKQKTALTVEKYKELKESGLKDAAIMSEFKMTINQMSYWKTKNDLVGIKNPSGGVPKKSNKEKSEVGVSETTAKEVVIDYQGELNAALQKIKELESEIGRKSLAIHDQIERNSKLMDQFAKAEKAEREARQELIDYQTEYRKLEVDFRNQSTELARFKTMLDRLKHTQQINVWLMEQHVGMVKQADEVFER